MAGVVVITGGSAGVGRATACRFAEHGWDVGLIARGEDRLADAAAEFRALGVRACTVSADMAEADAVEHAAEQITNTLGPIDVWVNNAMATVFAPVSALSAAEFARGTQVTYLGTVHGTMAALRRMRVRGRGTIVQVGSALSYRAIPLQSIYCGAKYAIRGFTDALRSELIHDRCNVHLTMVHLSAMNTPQFDWALNHMGRCAPPVPPIFQPEVAARAIHFAATHRRREVWVGLPTVKAILANRVAPGMIDDYLAHHGYDAQMARKPTPPDAPGNLFAPVQGHQAAHGRFDAQARDASWEMWTSRHRDTLVFAIMAVLSGGLAKSLMRRRR